MDEISIFLLIIVSILWGITNPMMKKSSEGIDKIECTTTNWIKSFLLELKFLIFNWRYLLAFMLNQIGSFLYYYTLGRTELSIAGPLTNTLTFVFTYLFGMYFFNEKDETGGKMKQFGLFLICSGVSLCVIDKL